MATSSAVLQGLLRAVVWRDLPSFARLLCPVSVPAVQHYRCVHLSPELPAKSLIHKFSSKTKKKIWYDSPCYTNPDNKPYGLVGLIKEQPKENTGNNVRVRALNMILYKALTGMLSTAEVSEEVFDLHIELSKVSVTVDISACRAYWKTTGNKDTDAEVEKVLQKYAPRFRHLLISHRVLGHVPPIVFLKDKEDAKREEVEDLLATLDFGDNSDPQMQHDDVPRKLDSESPAGVSAFPAASMFGIDHLELNRKIFEYKKKMKESIIENDGIELSKQQQKQLAEIRKQKLQKKKLKRQKETVREYVSPQDYLLAADNDLYSDTQEKFEAEMQDNIGEFEEEEEAGGRKFN